MRVQFLPGQRPGSCELTRKGERGTVRTASKALKHGETATTRWLKKTQARTQRDRFHEKNPKRSKILQTSRISTLVCPHGLGNKIACEITWRIQMGVWNKPLNAHSTATVNARLSRLKKQGVSLSVQFV